MSPARTGAILPLLVVGLGLLGCDRPNQEQPQGTAQNQRASGLAIRPDSTVILVLDRHRIAAINDTQQVAWIKEFPEDPIIGMPQTALDSTVFVLTQEHIHAIDQHGAPLYRWPHKPWFGKKGRPERYQLLPTSDSTLVACNGWRDCVRLDKQGEVLWHYQLTGAETFLDPPAVALDGSLYIRTESSLHVVSNQGTLRWRMSEQSFQ